MLKQTNQGLNPMKHSILKSSLTAVTVVLFTGSFFTAIAIPEIDRPGPIDEGENARPDKKIFAEGGLGETCFTYSALAMTPSPSAIQNNLYSVGFDKVQHNKFEIDTVILNGPLLNPSVVAGGAYTFSVTYSDSDGKDNVGNVKAELKHTGRSGIRTIITLNSSEEFKGQNTAAARTMEAENRRFRKDLSADDGYYFVRISLDRSDTAVTPGVFGYGICTGPEID